MRILILGGDGFCGWPSALALSNSGHEIQIADNQVRRSSCMIDSLTPIASIQDRLETWRRVSGKTVGFVRLDIAENPAGLLRFVEHFEPQAIVHFAEQRAAPYSMKTPDTKRYTVFNNIQATHNVLSTIVETGRDIHLVHLGSTGCYGYGAFPMILPEGYLTVKAPDTEGRLRDMEILHPASAGSVYHMTKIMDEQMFQFYAANDGVRITDLHQGIVWGTQTQETLCDDSLINRFDYDGDYGTVLNRFLMQAAVGFPLTVYGTGGQSRAFIHIQDSAECVRLAVENSPEHGRPRILNQMTEVHKVSALASLVADLAGATIQHLPNPRKEAPENDLCMKADGLKQLGLRPTLLADGLLAEIVGIAGRYKERCDFSAIRPASYWTLQHRQECANGHSS